MRSSRSTSTAARSTSACSATRGSRRCRRGRWTSARWPTRQARIATRKAKWDRKYQAKHGIKTGKARDLSDEQRELLSRVAKRTYRALYMSGFARMDFRLRNDGRIFLLEANANPNLSKGEDLADSAKAVGMSYTALVNRIVQLGSRYMPEWRMFEP